AVDPFGKGKLFKLFPRVPARFCELRQNILQRGHSDGLTYIVLQGDLPVQLFVPEQVSYVMAQVCGHALHKYVSLWVDSTGIERIVRIAYTKEACGLFKCFFS